MVAIKLKKQTLASAVFFSTKIRFNDLVKAKAAVSRCATHLRWWRYLVGQGGTWYGDESPLEIEKVRGVFFLAREPSREKPRFQAAKEKFTRFRSHYVKLRVNFWLSSVISYRRLKVNMVIQRREMAVKIEI